MWTQGSEGSVFWTEQAKMFLIGLLKQNPEALSSNHLSPKKAAAWTKIYKALIKAGMPESSIMKTFSQHGKKIPLSKLNQAIINLLNGVNSPSQDVLPKPKIQIKKEAVENVETHDENAAPSPKRVRLLEKNLNPIVKLDRIVLNNDTHTQSKTTEIKSSTEYWDLMKKVAENELKLKLAQRENEEERMEIERETHRKNMILADLKIKVQQMQIEALQGQVQFD